MEQHHLAQANIARFLAPPDDPLLADFMAGLDPVNAIADVAPGFVWRLQTDEGNATSLRPDPADETLLINMSVWTSVEALADFVYRQSDHVAFLRRRREWFSRMASHHQALWWIPAGTVPTVPEAMARVAHLDAHGPTPEAFTFARRFGPPGGDGEVAGDARDVCSV